MRTGRGVLLDLTEDSSVAEAATGWCCRIDVIAARSLTQPAPAGALLIRPDGYVAWAARPDAPDLTRGLPAALRSWFGRPAAAAS
jgi:hypothetical protein